MCGVDVYAYSLYLIWILNISELVNCSIRQDVMILGFFLVFYNS